jgi:hypothetical protein
MFDPRSLRDGQLTATELLRRRIYEAKSSLAVLQSSAAQLHLGGTAGEDRGQKMANAGLEDPIRGAEAKRIGMPLSLYRWASVRIANNKMKTLQGGCDFRTKSIVPSIYGLSVILGRDISEFSAQSVDDA